MRNLRPIFMVGFFMTVREVFFHKAPCLSAARFQPGEPAAATSHQHFLAFVSWFLLFLPIVKVTSGCRKHGRRRMPVPHEPGFDAHQSLMHFSSTGVPLFAWWLFDAPEQGIFVHCSYWLSQLGIWSLSSQQAQSVKKVWSWRELGMETGHINSSEKCLEKEHHCNTLMVWC